MVFEILTLKVRNVFFESPDIYCEQSLIYDLSIYNLYTIYQIFLIGYAKCWPWCGHALNASSEN
jgi:hypothetical protein